MKIRISQCDRKHLRRHHWFLHKSSGYLAAKIDGKHVVFHRYILNAKIGEEVDHINRNKLDNRRSNLRIVPRCINNLNKGLQKNNKSGHVGVHYMKKINRFVAGIGKPRIHLGCYKTAKDAAYVYKCMKNFIMEDHI